MIIKAVITYEDGTVSEFDYTPAVPEVVAVAAQPAIPVDLTAIPLEHSNG